ncbi:MAG: OB-fold nucleic acid binding domain-containing protein [Chloracidobacterium sp.]|nr:OB-fold nucleic acid binding domain-containing protein [Chloracidobacterium sp.]MDW8216319.1 OB-fold nucleic acid binding domain-containing protein [Acidobacteriota bacterium]
MSLRELKIVRVTPVGAAPTYNLTMRAPHHNYFVNGVLTANSHSVCYGILAYRTAYLKAHYPAHFWAAVLTNELSDSDKVARYLESARAQGVEILPPDVNVSQHGFTVTEGKIRFGLMAIKGLGEATVDAILDAREQQGPFRSLFHFTERVDPKALNRRVLESLVRSGAFDGLPGTRAQKFAAIDAALEHGARAHRDAAAGQVSLFDGLTGDTAQALETALPNVPDWTPKESLAGEKATLGFYLTGHPLAAFRETLKSLKSLSCAQLAEQNSGDEVRVGGIVSNFTVKNTKKGERFAVFSLEDETGGIEVIAWPETFRRLGDKVQDDAAILVTGRLELEDGVPTRLIAEAAEPLEGLRERQARSVTIRLPATALDTARVEKLCEVIDQHRGERPLMFIVRLPSGMEATLRAHRAFDVRPSPELLEALQAALPDCIIELQ